MQRLRNLFGSGARVQYRCFDDQYRPTYHGPEQRYVSPTTGKCRRLVVQAVHPKHGHLERTEVAVGEDIPEATKLAVWLVCNSPFNLRWIIRWAWFTLALMWPSDAPKYTGFYNPYLSKYHGHFWFARSPREYSLREAELGAEPVREITHSPCPHRLVIYNPASNTWNVCSDPNIIKQQRYVAISYRHDDIVPIGVDDVARRHASFISEVEAVLASLEETAYWIDLTLVDRTNSPEEVNKDVYRMADIYRSAQFTLIMLYPHSGITEEEAWKGYGERIWTLPEALLSRELRFKFRDGRVTRITLHQLAQRAYSSFAEESAIINSYGLRNPLERLERLSMLKAAIWRRTSTSLQQLEANREAEPLFRAEKVYALMGFFEHRIHPNSRETELPALARLSMANDNDRLVERMVSLLPPQIPDTACWYAETDEWRANLWDIEPEIQAVGTTKNNALVLGGCRAAAIRWKNFPAVAFATQQSYKRLIATYLPNIFWEFFSLALFLCLNYKSYMPLKDAVLILALSIVLVLLSPWMVAYGTSGRIVQAQPWLVGVKGVISAKEASDHLYGGAIFAVPRTSYTPSGTLLSLTDKGEFRRGDPAQLDALLPPNGTMDDDLYTLVDTLSATIYYFRAKRPPTVCLYTGRESGMGRFVLCSERCVDNELHKETVIRMPWHISQSMQACDWIALG